MSEVVKTNNETNVGEILESVGNMNTVQGIRIPPEELSQVVKEFTKKNYGFYCPTNEDRSWQISNGKDIYKVHCNLSEEGKKADGVDKYIIPKYIIVTKILENPDGGRKYFILIKNYEVVKMSETTSHTITHVIENPDINRDDLRILNSQILMFDINRVYYQGKRKNIIFSGSDVKLMGEVFMNHRLYNKMIDSIEGTIPKYASEFLEFCKMYMENMDVCTYVINPDNKIDIVNVYTNDILSYHNSIVSPIDIYDMSDDNDKLEKLVRDVVDRNKRVFSIISEMENLEENIKKHLPLFTIFKNKLDAIEQEIVEKAE